GLWQERFGGGPEIVGHFLQLDDKPYTIVGVMPREFAFPDREARAWTAWSVPPVVAPNGTLVGVIFRAIGRLRAAGTSDSRHVFGNTQTYPVSRIFPSWNHLDRWLRQVEGLRRVA